MGFKKNGRGQSLGIVKAPKQVSASDTDAAVKRLEIAVKASSDEKQDDDNLDDSTKE